MLFLSSCNPGSDWIKKGKFYAQEIYIAKPSSLIEWPPLSSKLKHLLVQEGHYQRIKRAPSACNVKYVFVVIICAKCVSIQCTVIQRKVKDADTNQALCYKASSISLKLMC